jgi:hypothetical protein
MVYSGYEVHTLCRAKLANAGENFVSKLRSSKTPTD